MSESNQSKREGGRKVRKGGSRVEWIPLDQVEQWQQEGEERERREEVQVYLSRLWTDTQVQ